jgi:hypothetical protein
MFGNKWRLLNTARDFTNYCIGVPRKKKKQTQKLSGNWRPDNIFFLMELKTCTTIYHNQTPIKRNHFRERNKVIKGNHWKLRMRVYAYGKWQVVYCSRHVFELPGGMSYFSFLQLGRLYPLVYERFLNIESRCWQDTSAIVSYLTVAIEWKVRFVALTIQSKAQGPY